MNHDSSYIESQNQARLCTINTTLPSGTMLHGTSSQTFNNLCKNPKRLSTINRRVKLYGKKTNYSLTGIPKTSLGQSIRQLHFEKIDVKRSALQLETYQTAKQTVDSNFESLENV